MMTILDTSLDTQLGMCVAICCFERILVKMHSSKLVKGTHGMCVAICCFERMLVKMHSSKMVKGTHIVCGAIL